MSEYSEFVNTDDVVTLYRNTSISENEDLTISQAESFDIVSNATNETVGLIGYCYNNDPNYIDYGGNIKYRIKEEYRGNGYAKRALTLMIDVLKRNTKYDQPLYVASIPSNRNFLNVAKECGGVLIHSGKVPTSVISSFYDREMRNVEVYQINIEKIKDKNI